MRSRMLEHDARLSRGLRIAEDSRALRILAATFAHSGDSWFWLLGLALLWLLGTQAWKYRALALGVGILVTAAAVFLIKFSVRRRRPEGEWGKFYRNTDPHSFPSGHAARAVMLAVLCLELGPPWFGVLLFAWAPLVSLARVSLGLHYLSDVVAGTVLGLVMGVTILSIY